MGSEALLVGVSGINFSSDYSLYILISNNPQIQYFQTFPTFEVSFRNSQKIIEPRTPS